LLDNSHEDSATELALWDKQGQHIIDRTFVEEKDGVKIRWIIDYKSSQPKADESLEAFVEIEKQTYQKQLERYKGLFKADNIEIRAALYFALIQQWVEV
jgi:G3E family GTPase